MIKGRKNSPTWSIINLAFYQASAFWFWALAHNIHSILFCYLCDNMERGRGTSFWLLSPVTTVDKSTWQEKENSFHLLAKFSAIIISLAPVQLHFHPSSCEYRNCCWFRLLNTALFTPENKQVFLHSCNYYLHTHWNSFCLLAI